MEKPFNQLTLFDDCVDGSEERFEDLCGDMFDGFCGLYQLCKANYSMLDRPRGVQYSRPDKLKKVATFEIVTITKNPKLIQEKKDNIKLDVVSSKSSSRVKINITVI